MGVGQSKNGLLSPDHLNEYAELTFLTTAEINELFKQWKKTTSRMNINSDINSARIDYLDIAVDFPQLEFNPFKDRLCRVFSSQGDGCFSFEDLLDLFSVMSHACPNNVKAKWAFLIFDFDGDGGVGEEDIMEIAQRLTTGYRNTYEDLQLELEMKRSIARTLLKQLDLESSGSISVLAFEHGIGKMSNFGNLFSFRV